MAASSAAPDLSRLDTDSFYAPYPKQEALHTSPATNLLGIGGNGSGKSAFLLGEAIYICLEFPGADCLLVRKNWKELEKGLILDLKNTLPAIAVPLQRPETRCLLPRQRLAYFLRSLPHGKRTRPRAIPFQRLRVHRHRRARPIQLQRLRLPALAQPHQQGLQTEQERGMARPAHGQRHQPTRPRLRLDKEALD